VTMPEAEGASAPAAENLWAEILAKHAGVTPEGQEGAVAGGGEAQRPQAQQKDHVLLVLGDPRSGKSALTARIRGTEDAQSGDLTHRPAMALDFSFMDVYTASDTPADSSDDGVVGSRRVSVWQLQGEPSAAGGLLKFAVSAQSLARTTVLVVLDGSQPWFALEQLRRWLGVLETHLASLLPQLRTGELAHLKAQVEGEFAATRKLRGSSEPVGDAKEELLEANTGVRVVVVLAKSDLLDAQERQRGFDDPHFQWIHAHLRQVCLRYGASLVYCSSKTGTNVERLRELLSHRILRDVAEFPEPAKYAPLSPKLMEPNLDDREAIFIGAGCDAEAQTEADVRDAAQALGVPADAEFEEAIKAPATSTQDVVADAPVTAHDDSEFLQELFDVQGSQPVSATFSAVPPATPDALDTASRSKPTQETLVGTGTGSQPASSNVTPVRAPPAHLGGAASATSSPVVGTTDHTALSAFFNSLKNSPGATPKKG
jgi:Dynein light intermediate chain (DLIC)